MSKVKDITFKSVANVVDFVINAQSVDSRTLDKLVKSVDVSFLKSRHMDKHFENMLNRYKEGNFKKASAHAQKVRAKNVIFANDCPFEVNDEISVVREEHGYHSTGRRAKVIERSKSSAGVWSYIAVVYDEENRQYDYDYKIEINHTRDAYLY